MSPKRTRKYPTEKKTTTREGKREYHRYYMRDYRKAERARDLALKNRLKELDKNFHNRLFPPRRRRKKE